MKNLQLTRLKFRDISGWPGIDQFWLRLLRKHGKSVTLVNDKPDVLLYSAFGYYRHRPTKFFLKNKARTVYFTGENTSPDKYADFNITFDPSSEHNNLRLPLWAMSPVDASFKMTLQPKSKFCSFIYSHKIKHRNLLCQAISQYRRVDCGGGCLNNIGYKVTEKKDFQKDFKFDIACENSDSQGYVTEKILNAYYSHCIPIYWGARQIEKDFNPETFINARSFRSTQELVEYVAAVDQDPKLYESYFNKPIFSDYWQKQFADGGHRFYQKICDGICPST